MLTQAPALPAQAPSVLRQIAQAFQSFSVALRYAHLTEMSDAQLAARGLSRETLGVKFRNEISAL